MDMTVGNIEFNVENVKKMSYEDFLKSYKGVLKGIDIEVAYVKLTGKKVVATKIAKTKKKSK